MPGAATSAEMSTVSGDTSEEHQSTSPTSPLKRKRELLEARNAEEHQLLSILQSADESDAFSILERLRSGDNNASVLRFARTLPSPNDSAQGLFSSYRQQYIADRLSAGPPIANSITTNSLVRSLGIGRDEQAASDLNGPDEPFVAAKPTLPSIRSLGLIDNQIDADYRPHKAIRRTPSAPNFRANWQDSQVDRRVAPTRLPNRRLNQVKALDWGVTYISDEAFRNILCSYFVWDHPTWRFFDEDAFLNGLLHQPSELPSELLVHAVVAYGAKNYLFLDSGTARIAGDAALEAAKKLWDADADQDHSLATACAGTIICALLASEGNDKLGLPYAVRAHQIVDRFGLFDAESAAQVYDSSTPQRTKERAVIAWSLYAYAPLFEMNYRVEFRISTPPPVEFPRLRTNAAADEWIPWPMSMPRLPAYTDDMLEARAKLFGLVGEFPVLQKRYAGKPLTQQYLTASIAIYKRIQDCWNTMNPMLRSVERASPHLILLHAWYHHAIVELFRPFTIHPSTSAASAIPLINAHLSPEPALSAATTAAVQLRHLLHRLSSLYEGHPINVLICPPALGVAFETMSSASPTSNTYHPIAHACFLLSLRLLLRMAKAFPVTRFVVLGIERAAARSRFKVPMEAEEIFADARRDAHHTAGDNTPDANRVVDLTRQGSNLQSARLGDLIQEMDALDMEQHVNDACD